MLIFKTCPLTERLQARPSSDPAEPIQGRESYWLLSPLR